MSTKINRVQISSFEKFNRRTCHISAPANVKKEKLTHCEKFYKTTSETTWKLNNFISFFSAHV